MGAGRSSGNAPAPPLWGLWGKPRRCGGLLETVTSPDWRWRETNSPILSRSQHCAGHELSDTLLRREGVRDGRSSNHVHVSADGPRILGAVVLVGIPVVAITLFGIAAQFPMALQHNCRCTVWRTGS